jgi:hypothetical protein
MRKHYWNTRLAALRPVAIWILLSLTVALSLRAQQVVEGPRVQVFAGYSGVRFDSKTFGFADSTNLNGWTGSAAYNFIPEFGVVGQIGGHYGPNIREVEWLIGPQVRYSRWNLDFFAHALFGKGQTTVTIASLSQKDNNRAYAFGGGFDFAISRRFSIRAVEVDYFRTSAIGADQANLKYSTGIVYRWGTVRRHKAPRLASP